MGEIVVECGRAIWGGVPGLNVGETVVIVMWCGSGRGWVALGFCERDGFS